MGRESGEKHCPYKNEGVPLQAALRETWSNWRVEELDKKIGSCEKATKGPGPGPRLFCEPAPL
jgi:hypothetical protein